MRFNKGLAIVGTTIAVSSVSAGAIAQSFAPGGLGGIFSGGGIYGGGGIGDIFSGGSLGDIFGDVLGGGGGGNLGGTIADIILGGNDVGGADPCNPVILNFAPTKSNCGGNDSLLGGVLGEILGNGSSDSIFDTVFDVVGAEMGLPSEITGIITGKSSIEDVFESILDDALTEVGLKTETSVIGAGGIPTYESLMESLTVPDGSSAGQPTEGLMTPNVIASLMNPTISMSTLTDVVSGRVLSAKGQEVAFARQAAGKTVTETSAQMGETADLVAGAQGVVAEGVNKMIGEQTSTQDTLKTAFTGLNLLHSQAIKLDSLAINQQALSNQMEAIGLDVAQEMNASLAVGGMSAALTNKQVQKTAQEQMAAKASLEREYGVGVRTFGAMR